MPPPAFGLLIGDDERAVRRTRGRQLGRQSLCGADPRLKAQRPAQPGDRQTTLDRGDIEHGHILG